MDNIISVDIEEWHHLGFAENEAEKIKSSFLEPLVVKDTLILLRLFKAFDVKATFFVLGETAQKYPDIIREIKKNNHEVASHGYSHTPVFKLNPQSFGYEIKKTSEVLSKITGQEILGYRAPHFSIENNYWAFKILSENGFLYDSSLKLMPSCLQFEDRNNYCEVRLEDNAKIFEFPISIIRIMGCNVAFSGGTYFRMLPRTFIKRCIENINRKGKAVHIYLHPRDIEEALPGMRLSIPNQLRYRGHFGSTIDKIKYLLGVFRFTSIKECLKQDVHSISS